MKVFTIAYEAIVVFSSKIYFLCLFTLVSIILQILV